MRLFKGVPAASGMAMALWGMAACAAAPAVDTAPVVVTSPDGRTAITIARDAGQFPVSRGGDAVIAERLP